MTPYKIINGSINKLSPWATLLRVPLQHQFSQYWLEYFYHRFIKKKHWFPFPQIVGSTYDSVQDADKTLPYYETIYALLDKHSPQYRLTFGEALADKLQLLQNEQKDVEEESCADVNRTNWGMSFTLKSSCGEEPWHLLWHCLVQLLAFRNFATFCLGSTVGQCTTSSKPFWCDSYTASQILFGLALYQYLSKFVCKWNISFYNLIVEMLILGAVYCS